MAGRSPPAHTTIGRSRGPEHHGFGLLESTVGAGTVTPEDEVLAAAGLGACEPDRVSMAPTVNTMAASAKAPAARAPILMRALRLSTQNRLPHLRQR